MDGWRAVSVMLVVALHVELWSSAKAVFLGLPQIDGQFGVQLFFGISGFVIARGLLSENMTNGRISLVGFYIRRLFRIVPPLLAYIAVVMILAHEHVVEPQAFDVFSGLTFTCNLSGSNCGGLLGAHLWSLSVEEQFYLVIPVLLTFFIARSKTILTIGLLGFPLLLLLCYELKQSQLAETLGQFSMIGFGVLAALHEQRVRRAVTAFPGYTAILALLGALLIRTLPPLPVTTAMRVLLQPPLIMYALLAPTFRDSFLSRFLSTRPIQILGTASYSIYLWQQLACYPFLGVTAWFYVVSLPVCMIVALASFRWVEKPLIRLGSSLSRLAARRGLPLAAPSSTI